MKVCARNLDIIRYVEAMLKREIRICPRCNRDFECKAGDIANCQCEAIGLKQFHRDFISQQYQDCLCKKCLSELAGDFDIKNAVEN